MKTKEYEAKCCMYDILVEFDRICKKNNIKYTLDGGTLIGAIRHEGYIPWDDDIDVALLRSEYDKFIKCCEKDLDKKFKLVNAENEDGNPNIFHKIKIKNTTYIEDMSKNSNTDKGIFLDVLPYDNSPNNYFISYIYKLRVLYYTRLLSLKCQVDFSKNKNILKRLINFLLLVSSKLHNKKRLIKRLNKVATKYNKYDKKYVYNYTIPYKNMVKKSWFSDYKLKKFENDKFSVIKDYDLYLRELYGDYMQLPPEEERGSRHKVIEIDLGDYKIQNYIKE